MIYVKLFLDYLDAIEPLSDAERGRLFTALLEYAKTGATGHISGNERYIFPMMRSQIDRDKAAIDSEADAIHAARVEAGKKGGLAKQANRSKSKQTVANVANDSKRSYKDKDKEEDKDKDEEEDEEEKKPAIAGKEKTAAAVSARAGEDRQARQAEKAEEERLFDAFWAAYPRKQGKQDALKAFHALKPDAKTVGVMLQAIQQQKNSQQWRESERFIPLPATWIRGKRWEDERIKDGGHQHFDAEREYTPASVPDMPDWLREELGQEAQPAAGSDMPDWVMDRWQDMQERGEV